MIHKKIKLSQLKYLGLLVATMVIMGCQNEDDVQTIVQKNWTLAWSDEFNEVSGTQPDSKNWTYDLGAGGWGNEELQNYTSDATNASMDGKGNLVITAIQNGTAYTSARIKTQGLFKQAYGRFEARIITPYGPGLWPAFWMLGSDIETKSWPYCGEIDIMELKGQQPNKIHGSLHGPGYSGGSAFTGSYALVNSRFDTDYHIYAVEWTEDKIDYYVDGYLYNRIEKSAVEAKGEWVFNKDFFLILNVAVGGTFVGFPTSTTAFPQKMYVDYVRVYK